MNKSHSSQMSMIDESVIFGTVPLDLENEWVNPSKIILWAEYEYRYKEYFQGSIGQPVSSVRIVLSSLVIKVYYQCSSIPRRLISSFRQRITPEMSCLANDVV